MVIDPISNFIAAGTLSEVGAMLVRLVDFLKSQGITALFTNLATGGDPEDTDVGISSIIDTWLLLRDCERDGQRQVFIHVLKSRGMAHSQASARVPTHGPRHRVGGNAAEGSGS